MGRSVKPDKLVAFGWASKRYNEQLWSTHRVGVSEYNEMFMKQDGKCPGCLRLMAHPFSMELKFGVEPELDHKHRFNDDGTPAERKPEDFRGILCVECNKWIGRLQDCPERIGRLAAYLKAYEDKMNGQVL